MLTITPRALNVIRRVTGHRSVGPESGLRIARRQDPSAPLAISTVSGPGPDDAVLERPGARVYLDAGAARRVDGGELDAVTDPDGRVQFVLRSAA